MANELRDAGYDVEVQRFRIPASSALRAADLEAIRPAAQYTRNADFSLMEYSGNGEVTGKVLPVDADPGASSSGCESADFDGFERGSVALILRGTCTFEQKAKNAEDAGASAVLVSNTGGPGRTGVFDGTLGEPGVGIPVLGTSAEVGESLVEAARDDGARARVVATGASDNVRTTNVIADLPGGDAGETVVVGAHLDSVPEGPGINDNGSGSATVLEIALQMAALEVESRNHVRFAFWGAEEIGLLGSQHYVDGLEDDARDNISAYLNFDMLGSPNFVRYVYDGPDEVAGVFEDYFAARDTEVDITSALDGRSDHGPFQDAGVPTGGLFSGAGGTKTTAEQSDFGGQAGEPYDRCYHRGCDDVGNLNTRAIDELSDGAAHATVVLANR